MKSLGRFWASRSSFVWSWMRATSACLSFCYVCLIVCLFFLMIVCVHVCMCVARCVVLFCFFPRCVSCPFSTRSFLCVAVPFRGLCPWACLLPSVSRRSFRRFFCFLVTASFRPSSSFPLQRRSMVSASSSSSSSRSAQLSEASSSSPTSAPAPAPTTSGLEEAPAASPSGDADLDGDGNSTSSDASTSSFEQLAAAVNIPLSAFPSGCTLMVPTDDAVSAILPNSLGTLSAAIQVGIIPEGVVTSILLYHVIPDGELTQAQLGTAGTVGTLLDERRLTFSSDGETVEGGGNSSPASVEPMGTYLDSKAYSVDRVLLPASLGSISSTSTDEALQILESTDCSGSSR